GLFKVRYPRETVGLMVYMFGYLQDFLIVSQDRDEYYRKMRAAEDIFMKVLGVKDGAIRLVE
ncbi:MAG TPA: TetR/AcrR family transcriptional regulator, partial [Methanocella sp.]|nr:TetR/AcrR family transcriptional regulator [Methanocella sp.]